MMPMTAQTAIATTNTTATTNQSSFGPLTGPRRIRVVPSGLPARAWRYATCAPVGNGYRWKHHSDDPLRSVAGGVA